MSRQFDVVVEKDSEGFFVAPSLLFPVAIRKLNPWIN